MLIRELHIDGFGIFRDCTLRGLTPGLALFVGHNESGKTTLMEFVRAVLFRETRRGRNDYAPLRGGTHGGRLAVEMHDGRSFVIERNGKRVSVAGDGGILGQEELLDQLLGNLDRPIFEKVFAIGLEDLQGMDVLSDGRLAAAGAGLGGKSLPQVTLQLERELSDLLKRRRGTSGQINRLQEEAEACERTLDELRRQSERYAALRRQLADSVGRLAPLRGEMAEVETRLAWLDRIGRARQPWNALVQARRQLERLDHAERFPPDGWVRFAAIQEKLASQLSEIDRLHAEIEVGERERDGLSVDERLLAARGEIDSLVRERAKLDSALDDLPRQQIARQRKEEEFATRLRDLGPEWTVDRLQSADTSVAARQQVKDFARRWQLAEAQLHRCKADADLIQREAEQAAQRAAESARQWRESPAPPCEENQWIARREAMPRIHSLWHRGQRAADRLAACEAARRQAEGYVAMWQSPSGAGSNLASLRWIPAVLGGVLAAGAVVAWLLQSNVTAGLLGSFAIVTTVGLWLWLRYAASLAGGQFPAALNRFVEERRRLDEERALLGNETAAARGELEEACRLANCDVPAGDADVERLASDLDRLERQWQAWARLRDEAQRAERESHDRGERSERSRKAADQAAGALAAIHDDWTQWLDRRHYDANVRPDQFETVVEAIDRAKSAEKEAADQRLRVSEIEGYVDDARSRINAVAGQCGASAGARPGPPEIDALAAALQSAAEAFHRRSEIEARLARLRAAESRLTEERGREQSRLLQLFAAAGAADEEGFRRLAQDDAERRQAAAVRERCELELATLAGSPEARDRLEAESAASDAHALDDGSRRLKERRAALADELSASERQIGALNKELSQLVTDDMLGRQLLEHKQIAARTQQSLRRWAARAVCLALLDRARGIYERESQPAVIRHASALLETMTAGRYRLLASLNEEQVHLEDARLQRKSQRAWSSGLADQAYLAVRLGWAREFGRQHEPLPVILDDVLVRFDPDRRELAARVLLEFARSQQVLLFSCHPELAEVVLAAGDREELRDVPCAVYNVDDGRITCRQTERPKATRPLAAK